MHNPVPKGLLQRVDKRIGAKTIGATLLASPVFIAAGLYLSRKSIETHRDMYIESYFDFEEEENSKRRDMQEQFAPIAQ